MTFWYMQVHPGSQPREYNADVMYASILRTRDVGMGDEDQWGEEGRATQARFREDVHEGDVAVIAHGKKLMLLVRFGKFGINRNKSDDGHWYGLKRDVEILSADHVPYALAYTERTGKAAADGLPIRQTLARIKSNDFAKFWYDHVSTAGLMDCADEVAEMPELVETFTRTAWRRNGKVGAGAVALGVCEACGTDKTFLKENGRQYFEGHHLVPLSRQASFNVSLDVPANVVCLCPTCHRFLHFGATQDRRRCLLRIYEKRADALAKSKIAASKSQFVSRTLGLED